LASTAPLFRPALRLPNISRSIRSNNRLGTPEPDHGDNQMKEKDEDFAPSRDGIKTRQNT
jgi:hypothetical protein